MNQQLRIDIDLPPAALAQQYFRDGGGLDSNPYPVGSQEHESFMWAMHRLQAIEFKNEQDELRAGI